MHALEAKVPPLVVVLVVAGLMWLVSHYFPLLAFAIPARLIVALAVAGIGIGFTIAGVLAFRKAKTTVNPTTPEASSTVVTTGVYGLSRNPMYVGMLLGLVGWAIFLAHWLALCCVPLFVIYMNRFQIAPEERALSAHFGRAYTDYLQSVRRWI
jgi:protein-S-isoprenylcysteine O-methyltransferase Ste14